MGYYARTLDPNKGQQEWWNVQWRVESTHYLFARTCKHPKPSGTPTEGPGWMTLGIGSGSLASRHVKFRTAPSKTLDEPVHFRVLVRRMKDIDLAGFQSRRGVKISPDPGLKDYTRVCLPLSIKKMQLKCSDCTTAERNMERLTQIKYIRKGVSHQTT